SIPTKTVLNSASTIILISSSSSARLMEASVDRENGYFLLSIHSIIAGNISFFSFFLFPMKLSSTKNTPSLQPREYNLSSSAITWLLSFVLGILPKSEVMLQNSQSKGQPREYWMLMEAYCLRSKSSHRGRGVVVTSINLSEV